jgi:hypothetical protein
MYIFKHKSYPIVRSGEMKKYFILPFCLLLWTNAVSSVIELYDWGFNVNGSCYLQSEGSVLPSCFNSIGFDWSQGLGTIDINFAGNGAGEYQLLGFFDHEIDQNINNFTNEYGEVIGYKPENLVWEIDEPGYRSVNPGDIYWNFIDGTLDNANGVPENAPYDVSMALGWNFTLAANETAHITFTVGSNAPEQGFYLSQIDPQSLSNCDPTGQIFFSSNIHIENTMASVPEPSACGMVILGLIGLFAIGFVSNKRHRERH